MHVRDSRVQECDDVGLVRVGEQLMIADVERSEPRGDAVAGRAGGLPSVQCGGEPVAVLLGVPGLGIRAEPEQCVAVVAVVAFAGLDIEGVVRAMPMSAGRCMPFAAWVSYV
ncbi:hypothetical protein SFIMM107S_04502 [Streptomyces griseus]